MACLHRFCALLAIAAALAGCEGGAASAPAPSENPPPAIGVKETPDGKFLVLQQSALGQPFLLQRLMAERTVEDGSVVNPLATALRSRIVLFRVEGDELSLYESSELKQPGEELPLNALLGTFAIRTSTDQEVVFDFNGGMTDLDTTPDNSSSKSESGAGIASTALAIADQALEDAAATGEGVVVTEAATVKIVLTTVVSSEEKVSTVSQQTALKPVRLTYFLAPYQPNSSFTAIPSPGLALLGYFETNPFIEEGRGTPYRLAQRIDASKPFTFLLSTAVPERYREAVKQGVLYWNRVFGRDVVRVGMAPDGATAPDFQRNIIQWHTDANAGDAMAVSEADPLTGEILHAQIYLSSGWADVTQFIDIPRLANAAGDANGADGAFAQTMERGTLCTLRLSDFAAGLSRYRAQLAALPPSRVDAIVGDVLREVVAHEVGHVLGLRHNFAASMTSAWRGDQESSIVLQYLRDGSIPADAAQYTSSIMDYFPSDGTMLVGAWLARSSAPLPYDRNAITWGYGDGSTPPKDVGFAFCTDEDANAQRFADCVRHDAGKHLVERRAFEALEALKGTPRVVFDAYVDQKADPDPKLRGPVETYAPGLAWVTSKISNPLEGLFALLSDELRLISIEGRHGGGVVDADAIADETLAWQNSEIAFAGGVDAALAVLAPDTYAKAIDGFGAAFEKIINDRASQPIALPEGGSTSFNADEITAIRTRGEDLLAAVDGNLAASVTSALKKVNVASIEEVEKVEAAVARWAEFLLTAGDGTDFRYGASNQKSAAELLTKSKGPFEDWLDGYVGPIAQKFRQKLEARLGTSIDATDLSTFPREERQWIADKLEIYRMLAPAGSTPQGQKPILLNPVRKDRLDALRVGVFQGS